MVNIVDKDGTGNIDFPEFLSMMAIKVYTVESSVKIGNPGVRTLLLQYTRDKKCIFNCKFLLKLD